MTLISQDDHLTAGTWLACGMRDLANASLWSRKWWSKSKKHFFFSLCIQIGHAMPACTHIVVPTFDTLLAELMVVHFTFHPFSNSLGKFFTRPQHSCQTSSMGLRINLGRLHQFPAQNFQRRTWETTTCTVAQNMRKKIKTILEIWAEVWPLCSNQRPKPKQMPCLLSLTEFQWCQQYQRWSVAWYASFNFFFFRKHVS